MRCYLCLSAGNGHVFGGEVNKWKIMSRSQTASDNARSGFKEVYSSIDVVVPDESMESDEESLLVGGDNDACRRTRNACKTIHHGI